MVELREAYERKLPALQRAKEMLGQFLRQAIAAIDNRYLVRAEKSEIRIKDFEKLAAKVEKNGWPIAEALWRCSDLVGGRVVCNNIEDVYRFAELFKEAARSPWHQIRSQDFIKQPSEQGYRALHINLTLEVLGPRFGDFDNVPCEVQIRTRLQDAWAQLVHDDVYKQHGLPNDLRDRAADLSEILAAADKVASGIRTRVRQEVDPTGIPDLSRVSTDGLAAVFRQTFGRSPPAYAIRQSLDLCAARHILALERLPGILGRSEFRDKLSAAFQVIAMMPAENEDIFLAALYALAGRDQDGIRWIQRKARKERREIDRAASREVLSSMPDSVDELVDDFGDVETLARGLCATTECAVCGATIVQPDAFAEAVVDHLGLPDTEADEARSRIETAIRDSGVETGGWGDGSLCAYHHEQLEKDD